MPGEANTGMHSAYGPFACAVIITTISVFAAKILSARVAKLTKDMMLLRSSGGKMRKHSKDVSFELAKVRKKLTKVNQLCGDDLSAAAFQALMTAIRSSSHRYGSLVS